MSSAELRLIRSSEILFNPVIMYIYIYISLWTPIISGLPPFRNATSLGHKSPQNARENHFYIDRSDRFVTMQKSVGILLGRADTADILFQNILIWINSHHTCLFLLYIVMSICFCFAWKGTAIYHFRTSSVSFIFVIRALRLSVLTELVTDQPWLILRRPLDKIFIEYLLCLTLIPHPAKCYR